VNSVVKNIKQKLAMLTNHGSVRVSVGMIGKTGGLNPHYQERIIRHGTAERNLLNASGVVIHIKRIHMLLMSLDSVLKNATVRGRVRI
jgi:hypothetical protein